MSQNPNAVFFGKTKAGKQSQGSIDGQGTLLTSQGHGLRYGMGYSQRGFAASSPTPVQTSVGLATTYTGLCLSNPASSTVNLSITIMSALLVAATTAQTSVGLMVGFAAGGITAHTTPLVPISTFVGSGLQPQALVDSACTLVGTPTVSRWLGTLASGAVGQITPDLQGGLIVPPGGYVAIITSVASAAAGFLGTFEWEECAP